MAAIAINNATEAEQRLHDALNILDAIAAYSINHRLSCDHLLDIRVRKRLQSLYPKVSSPIHPLLRESDELTDDEKKILSPYCHKIEDSTGDFDDVLGGLEAYYKQMNAQNLAGKGEHIDNIIRGGVSKTIKSVAGILDVIGSLALWCIREEEARTLATERGHMLVSQEDKSNAATEMWQYLSGYNSDADRAKLDARISAGIRKFPTKLIIKLGLIVTDISKIVWQGKKATPCVQKLLDSRLGPWTGSQKRQLPVQSVSEPSPKGRGPVTEVESGIPGGNSNSIGALLNAAEHIAGFTQVQQLPSARSSSIVDRTDSTPPDSLVPDENHPFAGEVLHSSGRDITAGDQPENWSNGESQVEALDLQRKRRRVDSFPTVDPCFSQASIRAIYQQVGVTKETSLGGVKAQDAIQVGSGMKMAIMAEVDKLESTLGGYLFKGMNASRMRLEEKAGGRTTLTDTVRLHVAYREGEDFKLEVWLCSSIGKAISEAKMRSVEDLRRMLGDYLFDAMNGSNWRKEEKRKRITECTRAVDVSFPNGDNGSDWKVEVMLNFGTGTGVYENIYPRVD